MRNVLVSEDFMGDVYRFVVLLEGQIGDPSLEAIRVRVEAEIEKKLEARKRRQMYTEYKTAEPGSPGREVARQKYLDGTGVHKDWRTSEEFGLDR